MNNETGQCLAEAIWALTNELRKADKGPSHAGAAPFTSGDTVSVTNPRHEWYGATGRVLATGHAYAHIDFSDGHTHWIDNNNLEKADDK